MLISHEHTKKSMVFVGDQNKQVIKLLESYIKHTLVI